MTIMPYQVVETVKFRAKIENLEKNFLPRIADFRKGLHITLSNDPFTWGKPIPKKPGQKYGFYFVGSSDKIGKFPSFDVVYRVDDDTVYLIDMRGLRLWTSLSFFVAMLHIWMQL